MNESQQRPEEPARIFLSQCRACSDSELDRAIEETLPKMMAHCDGYHEAVLTDAGRLDGLARLAAASERAKAKVATPLKSTPSLVRIRLNWFWPAACLATAAVAVTLLSLGRTRAPISTSPIHASNTIDLRKPRDGSASIIERTHPLQPRKEARTPSGPSTTRTVDIQPVGTSTGSVGKARPDVESLVAGWFRSASGQPKVFAPDNSETVATRGASIAAGSTITTGDADKAVIRFADGTTVNMDFNTSVQIPSWLPAATKELRPAHITLAKGRVFASVVSLPGRPKFEIKTQQATAVALGTKFQVELRSGDNGRKNPEARLRVSEGTVVFKNQYGERTATGGMESWACEDQQPAEPKRFALLRTIRVNGDYMWPVETARLTEFEATAKIVSPQRLRGDQRATLRDLGSLVYQSDASAQNDMGVLYELRDDMGLAIRAYGRAVALAPDIALYRANLGSALRNIGNYERAIEELNLAVQQDLAWLAPREALSVALSEADRYDEADTVLDDALRLFPRAGGLWRAKAKNQLLKGRFLDGIDLAKKSTEMEPDNPESWKTLGLAYQVFKSYPEAESAFRRAVALSPLDSGPSARLGAVLAAQAKGAEALEWFERALPLLPHTSEKFIAYARFLDAQGRAKDYVRVYRQAIAILPDHPQAYNDLAYRAGRRYAPGVDLDEALRLANRAVELSNGDPNVLHTRSAVYGRRGELAAAQEDLLRCVEGYGYHQAPTYIWGNLVEIASKRGSLPQTIEFIQQLLRMNPPVNGARQAFAEALLKTGRREEAFTQLTLMLAELPTHGDALTSLVGNFSDSKPREVAASLRGALEKDPQDPIVNYNVAVESERSGDLAQAETYYRKAISGERWEWVSAYAHAWLASRDVQRGEFSSAVSHLTKSVAYEPDQIVKAIEMASKLPAPHLGQLIDELEALSSETNRNSLALGDLCVKAGQSERALECYRRALKDARQEVQSNPSDPESNASIGGLLWRVADRLTDQAQARSTYSEGARYLEKALVGTGWGKTDAAANAWASLGITYDHLGRTKDSAYAFRKALTFYGSDPEAEWMKQNVRRLTGSDAEVQSLKERLVATPTPSMSQQADIWRHLEKLYEKRASYWEGKKDAVLVRENRLAAARALEKATGLGAATRADWVNLGQTLYLLDDKVSAASAFRKALAMDSNDADTLNWLADILLSRGENTEEALNLALKSAKLDPTNLDSIVNAGWAYYLLGDYTRAEEYLERSLIRGNRQADVYAAEMWTVLGIVYEELGRHKDAFDAYKTSIKLNANNPSVAVALKRPKSDMSMHRALIAAYQETSNFDDGYRAFVGTLINLDRNVEAVELYRLAVATHPQDLWSLRGLADRLTFVDPQDGVAVAKRIIEEFPNDGEAYSCLGMSYANLGKYEESKNALGRAQTLIAPDDRWAQSGLWYRHGVLYAGNGELTKAIAAYRKSLEFCPDTPHVLTALSIVLAKYGQWEAAEHTLLRAVSGSPVQSWGVGPVYETMLENGQRERAERIWQQIRSGPGANYVNTLNGVAWVLIKRGERLEEAIELCLRATEIDSTELGPVDNIGWAYFKMGDLDRALPYLERALSGTEYGQRTESGQPTSWAILAQIYERKGRIDDARKAYLQSLRLDPKEKDATAGLKRIGG